jgi:hypothetical protein
MTDEETQPDSEMLSVEPQVQPAEPKPVQKTPTFCAANAARYQRQALIRDIEQNNPRLLCYVAQTASLDRSDVLGFFDLLHNVPQGEPLDLLLNTPGGDVDATEKLVHMLLERVGDAKLRIIVPDFAKSAGTLMALGAHEIVMSDCSELGPIDPQMMVYDSNDHPVFHSIFNYLRAYEDASRALRGDPNDPVAQAVFSRFDPTTVNKIEMVHGRARMFADKLLNRRGVSNFTKITSQLLDIEAYPSHGQMIGWEEAANMGLAIVHMPIDDPTWRQYWSLYCHLRFALGNGQRIFESDYVSLVM